MTDQTTRARNERTPVPAFATTAFHRPPPLSEATVAIVTTAGLQRPDAAPWRSGDSGFRVFGREESTLTCSHTSNNFDRSGLVADLNVAYPLDRLRELEESGVIGAVAKRHLSFLGSLPLKDADPLRPSARDAAALLKSDGVDVVLLTPV